MSGRMIDMGIRQFGKGKSADIVNCRLRHPDEVAYNETHCILGELAAQESNGAYMMWQCEGGQRAVSVKTTMISIRSG
jgi:hypothetical protein